MKIKSQFVLRRVGSRNMIIDPSSGMLDLTYVYNLNDTAAWLWEQLQKREFSLNMVSELLMHGYGISYDDALRDAQSFTDYLKENNFLDE